MRLQLGEVSRCQINLTKTTTVHLLSSVEGNLVNKNLFYQRSIYLNLILQGREFGVRAFLPDFFVLNSFRKKLFNSN